MFERKNAQDRIRGGSLNVYFTAEEYKTLEEIEKKTGLTRARIIKTALMNFAKTNAAQMIKGGYYERKGE